MKHLLPATLLAAALLGSCTTRKTSDIGHIETRLSEVGPGWSATSVNTAVFRAASVATHADTQYVAYYDPDGYLTLGRRTLSRRNPHDDSPWSLQRTQYRANVADAHNVASIGIDGDGRLHASFDHHGSPLHYARSTAPGALTLGAPEPMTGIDELDVTYPEFYPMADGDLLFAYRSGASGRGNLVLNRYDRASGSWQRLHDNLIDGENERNAYWQIHVDATGTIHISWVWRETWLVETNHDICYARSTDGGLTWQRSDGTPYTLPITAATAEVARRVPQGSELINQTSMTADAEGNPYIATYWRDADSDVPQYRLVRHDGTSWHTETVGRRSTPFSLAGGGTKMIPISRPRLVSNGREAYYLFRDAERGSHVSMAYTPDLGKADWQTVDLTDFSVDAWEPTVDMPLWSARGRLDIFVQTTHQGDGEALAADTIPTPVSILTLIP